MKKNIFILILILYPVFINAKDTTHDKFRNILDDLDNIIMNNQQNELSKMFIVVKNKAMNKELVFHINHEAKQSIFGGAGFTPKSNESKDSFIGISPYLVDLYEKKPSIILSILIHEHVHAYHYFEDPNYFVYYLDNPLEHYLYEFDATYYEAFFIDHYLLPKKYNLSKYEDYLLKSYKNKLLVDFSSYCHGRNYNIAYKLYEIRKSKQSFTAKLKQLEILGYEIIKNCILSDEDEKLIKYNKLISLSTYYNFIPQVIFDILDKDSSYKLSPKDFSIKNYKEIYKIYQEIDSILTKDNIIFCQNIRSNILRLYEKVD